MARFRVVTVTGWVIGPDSKGHSGPPGEAFAVLDSAVCYRIVGEFRAGGGLTAEKRRAKAESLAAELERAAA